MRWPPVLLAVGAVAAAVLTGLWFLSEREHSPPIEEKTGEPWFRDVTAEVGLDFVHDPGPVGKYFMPQIIGSGAALLDFDNDGRPDIYLIQNAGPDSRSTNRLFRQTEDGRFVDVSKGSGLDISGYGMGAAVGDVNNDGWVDIVVTEFGRTRLFLNQGNGKFRDATAEAGLDNPLWGCSACFVDFDRDGRLDLVIANYLEYSPSWPCHHAGGRLDYCHPSQFPGQVVRLYRNVPGKEPGTVRFEDVTVKAGLGQLPGPGLGVVCADFNGDGWPDIFIANDSKPNRLWINQKNGTFKEEAVVRGVAYNVMGQVEAGMGVALGDVDGDGLFDLFVTHLSEETHTFWKQGPRGYFQDRTAFTRLAAPRWRGTGFGTAMGDFNQDGALDLAVANGRVARATAALAPRSAYWSDYVERNQLFANDGTGRFLDRSPAETAFCGTPAVSRGLICADFDGDGALDLLITRIAGPARLYRNVAPQRGHWLLVRAYDPKLRRDAYGAEVVVEAGGRRWVRQVSPGQSFLCSGDPRAHFGLGSTTRVDRLIVTWPDGAVEDFPAQEADRSIVVRKGAGRPRSTQSKK